MTHITAKPLSFFPAADGRGKYHIAVLGGISYCGTKARTLLNTKASPIVYPAATDVAAMHPICCKRCAKSSHYD
jgi:hypothetical protein